jgi:hypothetical protein
MLNYEMVDGTIFLSTNDGKTFGMIEYMYGFGFKLVISTDFNRTYDALEDLGEYLPSFQNLEAIKYFALSLYLEHGAE